MNSVKFIVLIISLMVVSDVASAQSNTVESIKSIPTRTFANNIIVEGEIIGIGMVPPGGIVMFFGEDSKAFDENGTGVTGTPYAGWQLCNGQNGSPDLRDKFIAAAGRNYKVSEQGGSDSITLETAQMPAHSHSGQTNANGDHSHNIMRVNNILKYTWRKGDGTTTVKSGAKGKKYYDESAPMHASYGGRHTHSFSTSNTGGSQPHENRPAFFALAFIMRLPIVSGK
jgi:microcystin-dependent protein